MGWLGGGGLRREEGIIWLGKSRLRGGGRGKVSVVSMGGGSRYGKGVGSRYGRGVGSWEGRGVVKRDGRERGRKDGRRGGRREGQGMGSRDGRGGEKRRGVNFIKFMDCSHLLLIRSLGLIQV